MGLVDDFHTSSDEDGDELKYHNQSECSYGQEIIRNGYSVAGTGVGRSLCSRCAELVAEISFG
jgi:hypothetical protein